MCAGSGFVSQELYLHGYFSASIKLPADYTAGVVVAFYVSVNFDEKMDLYLYKFFYFCFRCEILWQRPFLERLGI